MTPTDPILSLTEVKFLRGAAGLAGKSDVKALCDSHEQLRARVAALEAEREQAYTRGRERGIAEAAAISDHLDTYVASQIRALADPPTRVPPGATLASEEVNPEDNDEARGDVDQRRP
jgi:hypothetical protein